MPSVAQQKAATEKLEQEQEATQKKIGAVSTDVASVKAVVAVYICGLVRHEVTPVSRRRTIRRELW